MKELFNEMKQMYKTRRIRAVKPFVDKWIAQDCVIIGTALGEICNTKVKIIDLFESDLRYWYDLDIYGDQYVVKKVNDFEYYSCPAQLSYTINENESRYKSYGNFCNELASDNLSNYAMKASSIAYVLDTLLSSRKNKRRKNTIPVTIQMIVKDEKVVLMSFSIDNDIDTTECYYNGSTSIKNELDEERTYLDSNSNNILDKFLSDNNYLDSYYKINNNEIFYGCSLLTRNETYEEALKRVLEKYQKADNYQSLFNMRLEIARMQYVYSIEKNSKAIIRYFGIIKNGEISLFNIIFPNVYYLENK
jgi:hypothetical protein